jgi:two-component system KDP operon response regulator KdpE
MKKETILVVDDDPRIVRLVIQVLGAVGYRVLDTKSGERALEMVALEQPDLVLLDIMLEGGLDGYAVCRRLREFSDVPVVMLTARARDADIIEGFEAGADDYLTKPFNSKELVARVRAVLRRTQRGEEIVTASSQCGDIEIDYAQYAVRVRGNAVALTRTEFAVLRELMLNANRVVLHQDLLSKVWGPEYRDDLEYLRAYIRYLRRKIEREPKQPASILTVPGIGYMLKCAETAPENRSSAA